MSSEPIKPGYKRTEVGVIPEEWSCGKLGELCYTSSGTTPSRSLADRYFRGGTVNWVKTLDLNNSEIITTDEQVTETALNETSLRIYPPKTVLVAMYGGFNQIGRTGILNIPACVNQAITAVQCGASLDASYLLSVLNFRVDYWKSVASSSRKDPNITSQDIRDFFVAYPSIKEQRAIATALSDVDALLAKLDQLIAKKRDLKQAAMQQLLTGQIRLPGFSGEWEVKRFEKICALRNERIDPGIEGVQEFCVELEHIEPSSGRLLGYVTAGDQASLKSQFKIGDVLFGKLRAYQRKHWMASQSGVCSTEIWVLVANQEFSIAEFLYHTVSTDGFIEAASTAYGTHMPRSDWSVVKRLQIALPGLDEQTAIAAVLSDMDAELAGLEARRDKTRALKQGMMQELLTGRIRLV